MVPEEDGVGLLTAEDERLLEALQSVSDGLSAGCEARGSILLSFEEVSVRTYQVRGLEAAEAPWIQLSSRLPIWWQAQVQLEEEAWVDLVPGRRLSLAPGRQVLIRLFPAEVLDGVMIRRHRQDPSKSWWPRQSSIHPAYDVVPVREAAVAAPWGAAALENEPGTFMLPTEAEVEPWFEVFLQSFGTQQPISVRHVAVVVDRNPAPRDDPHNPPLISESITLRVTGSMSFHGGPLGVSVNPSRSWSRTITIPEGSSFGDCRPGLPASIVRVTLVRPSRTSLRIVDLQIRTGVARGPTLVDDTAAALALWSQLPALGVHERHGRASPDLFSTDRSPERRSERASEWFAEGDPDRAYMWISHGELRQVAQRLSAGLEATLGEVLGVEPGGPTVSSEETRIMFGICSPNSPEWIAASYAGLHSAFVEVPMAADLDIPTLAFIVRRTRMPLVACTAEAVPRFRAVHASIGMPELIVVLEGDSSTCLESRPAVVSLAYVLGKGVEALEAEPPSTARFPLKPPAQVADTLDQVSWRVPARGPTLEFVEGTRRLRWSLGPTTSGMGIVMFTSGSSGLPKGAIRSYESMQRLNWASGFPYPAVHLSFQPLSHLSERNMVPPTLQWGGRVGFGSRGVVDVYEDARTLQPSVFNTVPAFVDRLHAIFLAACEKARRSDESAAVARARVMEGFRDMLGSRLQTLAVGSAPPNRTVMAWLRECLEPRDVIIVEGYGLTETGSLTSDNRTLDAIELRLEERPELGFVEPRGEIVVKTATMVQGYLGDDDATKALFTTDGFIRTGDVGERQPDGRVVVVGRISSVRKLGNGEFLSPERVERALHTSELVEQAFAFVESEQSRVCAVIVPTLSVLTSKFGPDLSSAVRDRVCAELQGVCARAGLNRFEIPAAVILELAEPFSRANGLLTESLKLVRARLEARYGLACKDALRDAVDWTMRVQQVTEGAAGVRIERDAPLDAWTGGGSLMAVQVIERLREDLGIDVPASAWFESSTVADLAEKLRVHASKASVETAASGSGDLDGRSVVDRMQRVLAEIPTERKWSAVPDVHTPSTILLTGATGFLGVHLLAALLARVPDRRVLCLVRAKDGAPPRARLDAALRHAGVILADTDASRVVAVAGDLCEPRLGLALDVWDELCSDDHLVVVHNGAVVNWLVRLAQVQAANVSSTIEAVRLVASGPLDGAHRRMFFVSTSSVARADLQQVSACLDDERDDGRLPEHALSGGYVTSKWLAEEALRAARPRVWSSVLRPGMISAHSLTGHCNYDDFVTRYVRGCLATGRALGESDTADLRLPMHPVDQVAAAIASRIVDAPLPHVWHLASAEPSPRLASITKWIEEASSRSLVRLAYSDFRAHVIAHGGEHPLHPILPFMAEDSFTLGMKGPADVADDNEGVMAHSVRAMVRFLLLRK